MKARRLNITVIGLIACFLSCWAFANDEGLSEQRLSMYALDPDMVIFNAVDCNTVYKDLVEVGSVNCLQDFMAGQENDQIAEIVMDVVLRTVWKLTYKDLPLPTALDVTGNHLDRGAKLSVLSNTAECHLRWAYHF